MQYEKEILISDLNDTMYSVAELIGLDKAIELSKMMGGCCLYIPTYDSVVLKARNRQIQKEFTGTNYKQLSQKYGVTKEAIRAVIKSCKE